MDDKQIFIQRMKDLRHRANFTQKQLGEAIGLSSRAISDIECGRRNMRIDKGLLMARLFNTTVAYLVGSTDDPTRR